jgi:hypothetical protein
MPTLLKEWLPLVFLGFNVAMFIVIKFNDMSHIAKGLTELKNEIKELANKVSVHSERIACLEGKYKATFNK